MNGLLIIDKPVGVTSFDIVRKVRGRLRRLPDAPRKLKVGHAGTLDPFATGVMLVCVGIGTKLAQYLTEADKTYRATVRLGEATDTEDSEGAIIATADPSALTEDQVRDGLLAMLGPQLQRPPIYSAIHVNGKRAYELARAGEEVELEPRPINIIDISVLSIDLPEATFDITASKGTYIRSICRDLGESLGVGGHCNQLRRLSSSGFDIDASTPLETVLNWDDDTLLAHLLPPIAMLRQLPQLEVDAETAEHLRHGRKPRVTGVEHPEETPLCVVHDDALICIAKLQEGGVLRVLRGMAS